MDGVRAAGEDDDAGVVAGDLFEGGGAAEDEGEDVEGADAAGDEVGVLGAEVEDEDCVGLHRGSLHERGNGDVFTVYGGGGGGGGGEGFECRVYKETAEAN